jgi:uncharacterized protein involved in outer membrane biogenesis
MKAMKRALRIAFIIIVAFAVVIAAGAIFLYTPPAKNYIRAHAEKYARRQYGAELKIDRFGFSLLKGSVSVNDLILGSAVEPKLGPLLKIKHAEINLNLISTLVGTTAIEYVRLENVDIHIVVDKDGRMNLPNFGGGGAGGGLLIRSLEIANGSLKIEDSRQQIGLNLPSWRIQAQGQGSDLLSQIILKTNKSGEVNYQEKRFGVGDLEIEAEMSTSTLKIRRLNLTAAGSKVEGSGSICGFSNPVFNLKINTEIDLEQAAAVFGLKPGVKGRANGIITITGPLGNLQIGGSLQGNIASARPAKIKEFKTPNSKLQTSSMGAALRA